MPFRKIVKHKPNGLWSQIEVLSCGHETLCKGRDGICCASQRRCYTCKREGYESPKNHKIRLSHERLDKECEPFFEKPKRKKVS